MTDNRNRDGNDAAQDQGHTYATNQTEIVEEGMQGATGNMDANGLSGEAGQGKLDELRENLSEMTDGSEEQ
ncbi:hypothetical protein F8S09_04355 [Deinococcus sp. SDU3-2]|uniref:Uncharacterized protein n=1 Tax=Deinococcus terrestris TaxID=2651870 RepID=A0A7X1NUH9_9DEIO|nr:hypothetical protein [Deinococcus terrestris]MPY65930.1 hypothetical protein [Deinococcus terrestris]